MSLGGASRLLLLVPGLFLALAPVTALARAAVVSSTPEPGQKLSSAPGVVQLRFSEPVNTRLTRARITAPDGRAYEDSASGPFNLQVALPTNAPGVYLVDWLTVSNLDGHTLKGSFRFGVQVSPGAAQEEFVTVPPGPLDLLTAVFRALEYAGLLTALGALLLRWLARRNPALEGSLDLKLPMAVAFLSGIAVVAGEAVSAAQSPSPQALVDYLGTGPPGLARLGRLALEGIGTAAVFSGAAVLAPSLVAALVALAFTGHAAAARPPWLGIGTDALHLMAAGVWAGGVLALGRLRLSKAWNAEQGADLIKRFGPYALGGLLLSVGLGLVRALQELDGLGDLLSSSYGEVLSLKAVAVAGMAVLAILIRFRRRKLLRTDAGLALMVVAATALLAAHPLPPRRAVEADAAAHTAVASPALPQPGDLTMGSNAGDVLVGLTIRPARPGSNQLLMYTAPLQPQIGTGGTPMEATVNGRRLDVSACGPACRSAEADLRGGERVVLRVPLPHGGLAAFELPALPAEDGTALMKVADARMHKLTTYRIHEVLMPALRPLSADYDFQVPDRMHLTVNNEFERISIGSNFYTRDRPGSAWQLSGGLEPINPRRFLWEYQPVTSPYVVGSAQVDGTQAQVMSFFEGSVASPI